MYEKQVHKDGIRRMILTDAGCATERHFAKADLNRLFTLAPEGVCEMMDKFPDAKFTDTDPEEPHRIKDDGDVNDELFLASQASVAGISFHDLLYTNVIANIEGEELSEMTVLDEKERNMGKGSSQFFQPQDKNDMFQNNKHNAKPLKKHSRKIVTKSSAHIDLTQYEHSSPPLKPFSNSKEQIYQIDDDDKENTRNLTEISLLNTKYEKQVSRPQSTSSGHEDYTPKRFNSLIQEANNLTKNKLLESSIDAWLDVLEMKGLPEHEKMITHKKIAILAENLKWL